jgi:hypothetical protein
MALLMRTEGLKPDFRWLPLTVLNSEEYVDHHFLFHGLLIPFTLNDLRSGAKLASVIFPALAFLAIWWLLRGQEVPLAFLWALGLLAVSEAFIYRMSMPRAQSLSLGVLALGLHWMIKKKTLWLAILAFLYVWLYNAFPLILILAGLYSLAHVAVERRLEWKVAAFATLGVALGLILNPYFPDNLVFLFRHLSPKLADATATRVGSEWYPYQTDQLIQNSGLAFLAFLAGVFGLGFAGRRMDLATTLSLLVAVLFGAMLFRSRRFVEYFPPFSLVFASLAWKPAIRAWLNGSQPGNSSLRLPARLSSRMRFDRSWLFVGGMILLLAPAIGMNISASRASLRERTLPYQFFAGASTWLRNNTPAGGRVFQTDWDDFPRLFFYNTHNTYTIGLDPTYMELQNPILYKRWVAVSQGRVDHLSGVISEEFGAEYIITDLQHGDFLRQARQDPGLEEIYRDEYAAVFRLRN